MRWRLYTLTTDIESHKKQDESHTCENRNGRQPTPLGIIVTEVVHHRERQTLHHELSDEDLNRVLDLVVIVPPNGYGEINYLRLDEGNTKTVWVRGV